MGILLRFVQSFVLDEGVIANEIVRGAVSAVFGVLRLAVPAIMFALMQKHAGFKKTELKKRPECSLKYNMTLAFGGFAVIFVFGLLYAAAFPMAAVSFEYKGVTHFVIMAVSSAVVPAIFEEWLYRKLICRELTVHGGAFAVIISALLFGLAHFSFYTFPYAFVCGLVLGFVYIKTGSAKYTAAVHFANNMFSILLSLLGEAMGKLEYTNLIMLIAIALSVMGIGAFYTVIPNMKKFAFCENGNVASSVFLTFSMTVYLACAVLMNFI